MVVTGQDSQSDESHGIHLADEMLQKKIAILVLSHYYPPEMGGAAARIHGLSRWLVNYGHDVTVITGFPNYPAGIIPNTYRRKVKLREEVEGVTVIRTWVHASSHKKSFGRLTNYLSFAVSSILAGITLRRRYDVVLATSPPLFTGVSGLILSRIKRIPFVLDIRDLWPDVAVDSGAFKSTDLFIRIARRVARFLYSEASHLTPVTEKKCEKVALEGVDREKITLVSNGVDLDRVRTKKTINWQGQFKLEGRFVAVYTGLIGIAQGVAVVVAAADALRRSGNIHFLIVGDGVERDVLMKRAEELALENVTFVPSQPREAVPAILAAADLVLVPLVSADLVDAVPSKLMEAWGCRKPVVLIADGEPADLVKEAGGGVVIEAGDSEKLAQKITDLSKKATVLEQYGENGYGYVCKHFDRKDLARKMEDVLLSVSGTRSK